MTKSQLVADLKRDGYVLIPSLLSPDELSSLREAAEQTAALARSGQWPHGVRTVGKQFPPWPTPAPGQEIWGVQHLMHPAMPSQDIYIRSYFSESVISAVRELLGANDDELVMELYNMLVRPDRDFELRWHRDDISWDATPEEELERLNKPAWHAQWNLALYDDASLIVVPGSHARARTDVERAAGPFETGLPGEKVVKMKAGDVVFYNNNILHRGAYDSKVQRMTLHGSIGHVKGSKHRARNVLQHGIGSWVDQIDFSVLKPKERERAEGMRERLIELGRVSGDVGYALKD